MTIAPIISEHVIDLQHDTNYVFTIAPQGDGRSRYCDIVVLDNGTQYIIPPASTIVIEGKNAGGFNIFNECVIADNKIRVPLHLGILSFAGLGEYRITIYGTPSAITSFKFNIFVTEAPYNVVELEASDSYEALENLVKSAGDVNKWIVGSGIPPSSIGNVKDYYLNSDDGKIYQKLKNSVEQLIWDFTGYILKEDIFIKYSEDSDTTSSGSPMVDIPTFDTKYIGIYVGASAPTLKSEYTWSKYQGENGNKWYSGEVLSGTGTGYTGVAGFAGDMYINKTTAQLFECVNSGDSTTALWNYLMILGGGGVDDYEDLGHLPKINNIELIGNKTSSDLGLANSSDVPTSTSQLTNDSNFVSDSNYVHTDSNYTSDEKNKLSNIEDNANNYTLPIASSTLGGVKESSSKDIIIGNNGELELSDEINTKLNNFDDDGSIASDSVLESELTNKLDEWTDEVLVASNKTVTFTNLDDSLDYLLFCDALMTTYTAATKSGSGSNTTLTYTLSGDNVVGGTTKCKLRIIKNGGD